MYKFEFVKYMELNLACLQHPSDNLSVLPPKLLFLRDETLEYLRIELVGAPVRVEARAAGPAKQTEQSTGHNKLSAITATVHGFCTSNVNTVKYCR